LLIVDVVTRDRGFSDLVMRPVPRLTQIRQGRSFCLPNEFWMLTLYAKAKHDTVPAHLLKRLKEAFEHD